MAEKLEHLVAQADLTEAEISRVRVLLAQGRQTSERDTARQAEIEATFRERRRLIDAMGLDAAMMVGVTLMLFWTGPAWKVYATIGVIAVVDVARFYIIKHLRRRAAARREFTSR